MRAPAVIAVVCATAVCGCLWTTTTHADDADVVRVQRILKRVPLVDGHNDLPWRLREKVQGQLARLDIAADTSAETLHTDLQRLRRGGVGAQVWSVYVPAELPAADAVLAVIEQIDLVHRMVQRYPETLALVRSAGEIEQQHRQGRIACLVGVEGGHAIGNSLAVLRQLYALGVRAMTLTHSLDTGWADACSDEPRHAGLNAFGVEVVHEMNRVGILVDLAHVSHATMHDALDASLAPVIFSHSSAYALVPHLRNVPDDVLQRLPANGGIVMVTFVPPFVSQEVMAHDAEEKAEAARLEVHFPGQKAMVREHLEAWRAEHPRPRATVQQVADHIAHVVRVAGIDHVGLGSDFDGMKEGPRGLESVADYPNLLVELLHRGYSDADVQRIAGRNFLRVWRAAEQVAARLRTERGAAETLFETTPPATTSR